MSALPQQGGDAPGGGDVEQGTAASSRPPALLPPNDPPPPTDPRASSRIPASPFTSSSRAPPSPFRVPSGFAPTADPGITLASPSSLRGPLSSEQRRSENINVRFHITEQSTNDSTMSGFKSTTLAERKSTERKSSDSFGSAKENKLKKMKSMNRAGPLFINFSTAPQTKILKSVPLPALEPQELSLGPPGEGELVRPVQKRWNKVKGVAQTIGRFSTQFKRIAEGNSESASATGTDEEDGGIKQEMREPLLTIHSVHSGVPADLQPGAGADAAGGPKEAAANVAGTVDSLIVGCVNVCMAVPAQIAFATIVFQDALYLPYISSLCKFFFFSSAIHQLTFMAMSSLPPAVGQVQDIGLVFLSAIASSVSDTCAKSKEPVISAQKALGTTLVTLSIATFIVGLLTLLIGKLKLARLTQYVPNPVVRGYLLYVGYFLTVGGLGLSTGPRSDTDSWAALFPSLLAWLQQYLPKLLCLLGSAVSLQYSCVRMKLLSAVLVLIPATFHLVLLGTGHSLEDAMDADWVMRPLVGSNHFWDLWRFFHLDLDHGVEGVLGSVHWPAVTEQAAKVAGLFMLVCFGSCFDVNAIQEVSPTPLDYDQELVTVGTSNIVTALLGAGYPGSYIISQTKFTIGSGVRTRISGAVIAGVELAVFALPFSVVQYMPKFFFGALLVWLGWMIMKEELWDKGRRMSRTEYVLLLLTFTSIMWFGLMVGIGAGIAMVTFVFAYDYAQSSSSAVSQVSVDAGTSRTMHSHSHMLVLDLLMSRVVSVSLSGFLFFGNSVAISDRVQEIASDLVERVNASQVRGTVDPGAGTGSSGGLSDLNFDPDCFSAGAPTPTATAAHMSTSRLPSEPYSDVGSTSSGSGMSATRLGSGSSGNRMMTSLFRDRNLTMRSRKRQDELQDRVIAHMKDAPVFIILDFSKVPRLDSTGAGRLVSLIASLEARTIQVVVSGLLIHTNVFRLLKSSGLHMTDAMRQEKERQRQAQQAQQAQQSQEHEHEEEGSEDDEEEEESPETVVSVLNFPSLEVASKYCEARMLEYASNLKLIQPKQDTVSILDLLYMHFGGQPEDSALPSVSSAHWTPSSDAQLFPTISMDSISSVLVQYFERLKFKRGGIPFKRGEVLNSLYVIESGKLHLYPATLPQLESACRKRKAAQSATSEAVQAQGELDMIHALEFGPGCFVCPQDFVLNQPTLFTARCFSSSACVLKLSFQRYLDLKAEDPEAFIALQIALTRSISLDLSSSLGMVNPKWK